MITVDFSGRTALVTGSSRGVGKATALLLARAGARVCVHYRQGAEDAKDVLAALPGAGHCLLQADVSDPAAARRLVDSAVTKLGHLDILVNNAGIFRPHPVDGTLTFEEWLATFQVTLNTNLVGPAAAAYQAIQHMRGRGRGTIINIGSRGAYRGEAGQIGYGAAKAGLHSLSQSLAQEVGKDNITVHAIAPGFIETAMVRPHLQGTAGDAVRAQSPLNRVATVEEVARAVLYLASPEAAFTTGSVLDLNGASYLH
ncbi:NAD(P)-dependent dehydrogenase (short-subunit alcohol dehydrogenase family) [Lewinella aquimaris]|uniref:NAD(P)-dependent dehydrogenase (Short-subunit alcohol dehydrogenase family) n=1 Tax=Neolewinella aquimaris TaxID=1835722 RepID=A0A840E5R2_9BACT|nr:SDR family NAD(P)-dependent oxidoreductase [Neolewinella aquimaris]MBB4078507.1 NAD(P)-dependent dehydrogenase (short-subunit alcohol dehydrogenase family) [Neolewinella aquimaris]